MTHLTLDEQERHAYISGHVKEAALFGRISDLEREISEYEDIDEIKEEWYQKGYEFGAGL